MKRTIQDYVFLFGIAALIVLLDQWSKFLVRTQLMVGEFWAPWDWLLPPFAAAAGCGLLGWFLSARLVAGSVWAAVKES